jgi:hypothetical protein
MGARQTTDQGDPWTARGLAESLVLLAIALVLMSEVQSAWNLLFDWPKV